jgi:hypothetical protein
MHLCRIQTVVKHWRICIEHTKSYVEEWQSMKYFP